jgi:hypothetical protein
MIHQFMRGWGANLGAALRLQKGNILSEIETLDLMLDSVGLTTKEWTHRYALETSLMEIYKDEELFWMQRSRQNWILKGDANTAYFHAIANGRRRKCSIPCLWDNDRLLEDNRDMSMHTYSFYKELFMAAPRSGVALAIDFWPDAARVTADENAELTLPFLPEEVARAIKEMKANLAPGPDGLPVSFFPTYWDKLQAVIMPMFHEFYTGTLVMSRLNFGVIMLIPKVVGATDICQFRLITMINVIQLARLDSHIASWVPATSPCDSLSSCLGARRGRPRHSRGWFQDSGGARPASLSAPMLQFSACPCQGGLGWDQADHGRAGSAAGCCPQPGSRYFRPLSPSSLAFRFQVLSS